MAASMPGGEESGLDIELNIGYKRSEFSRREAAMKEIEVSQSIVPLGKFKARAPHYLKEIAETGRPLILTQNGHSAAVLLSPEEYDRIRKHQRLLESIAAGLADSDAGRVMTTELLKERLEGLRAEREGR